MTHSKIIKDVRGTVIVKAKFLSFGYRTDINGNSYRWDVQCSVIPKGKRIEIDLDVSTDEEKKEAKLELWEKIKP